MMSGLFPLIAVFFPAMCQARYRNFFELFFVTLFFPFSGPWIF
jgi:hypothetical protein